MAGGLGGWWAGLAGGWLAGWLGSGWLVAGWLANWVWSIDFDISKDVSGFSEASEFSELSVVWGGAHGMRTGTTGIYVYTHTLHCIRG